MVYTDGVHLTADSLDELYAYASRVGLNPDWIDFMGRTVHPHFSICGHVKRRVLADINVQKVTCRQIVKLCIQNFRLPEPEECKPSHHAGPASPVLPLEIPSEADYERMLHNILKRTGIRSLNFK